MKWKNHLEIADAVSDQLGLPNELKNALRQGSIQPDREGDKVIIRDVRGLLHRRRMRHHRATKRFIRDMLWKARIAHLEDREEDAMWCLGRALHYIQDRSLSVGPFGWFHDKREGEIGRKTVFLEAIQLGEKAAAPSPIFVDLCLRSLSPKRGTSAAMYQACIFSSAMAFAVLADPNTDSRRIMELENSKRRYAHLFLPISVGAAMLMILMGFSLNEPLLLLSSLPLAAMALMLDSRFLSLRSEVRWSVPSRE
jgi:hypothetical protein